MTYREMIQQTAKLLGKPAYFIDFPLNCFGLSKHWVALFGSVPPALVGPLQESLQHDLEAAPNALTDALKGEWVSFEDSFHSSVDASGRPKPNPRDTTQRLDRQQIKQARRVRSVQRMPLPAGWDAQQIAKEYGVWLSRRFGGLIRAGKDSEGIVRFVPAGWAAGAPGVDADPVFAGEPETVRFLHHGRYLIPTGRADGASGVSIISGAGLPDRFDSRIRAHAYLDDLRADAGPVASSGDACFRPPFERQSTE